MGPALKQQDQQYFAKLGLRSKKEEWDICQAAFKSQNGLKNGGKTAENNSSLLHLPIVDMTSLVVTHISFRMEGLATTMGADIWSRFIVKFGMYA